MESILHGPVLTSERDLTRRILLALALWHHRQRSRRHLAALEDRELDDVGLSRDQRRAECSKRFWQA
ncbi:DUF1127 domain-containing protein [Reyranella sp.]|jgi:uncharacterized protein YjiS (DUF1127 family)|uniref:DUF1127 domain-containing protein n=1 Tax=Reyranella sp. TaxID=1929291 RepID=UPI003D149C25